MKTKEDILNKHDTSQKYIEQTCRPELFAAMDEYAKEVCIEYAKYLSMVFPEKSVTHFLQYHLSLPKQSNND